MPCNFVTIRDDVFTGPNVTFTNDKYPKIKSDRKLLGMETTVKRSASIGAGSVILPVSTRENSLVAAGSVVTKDVPNNVTVAGKSGKDY